MFFYTKNTKIFKKFLVEHYKSKKVLISVIHYSDVNNCNSVAKNMNT